MTKYTYAEKVTKKVRQLFKHDNRFSDFLSSAPSITLDENYCLANIVWNYYDVTFIVGSTVILFRNHGMQTVLMNYDSFDSLIGIK